MDSCVYPDSLNEYFERTECVSDIILNLDYWDCECEDNYIHPICQQRCIICGYTQEECPSSRENEVRSFREQGLLFDCHRKIRLATEPNKENNKMAREKEWCDDDTHFPDVKMMKALELENRQLKEIIIEQAKDNNTLKRLLSQNL